VIHAQPVRVIAIDLLPAFDSRMSCMKGFEHFGSQRGRYKNTFLEQNTSLLAWEGFSASVETFRL